MEGVASSTDRLDRLAASRDAWPGGTLSAWQGGAPILPERVFWPEDEDQVAAVLRRASAEGAAVVPYGAGSGVCGGASGLPGAWVVDTKRLARLEPPSRDRWIVRAGAGVNGQQLEDHLARHGFTLGHSPSSIGCSTVGGWAAARSAGQFSSKYGVFEDMVTRLRFVAPARGAFTVGQGAERDDDRALLDVVLGSEGTLGVVTEAEMRVWPAPEARWLRGYRFPDMATALDAMRALMQGELYPSVVRLYDPVDTRIGGRTRPKAAHAEPSSTARFVQGWLARVDRMDAVHRRSLALPLALPSLVNRVFGRIASGCLLIVGWEGAPAVVEASAAVGHRILCATGEDLGAEPGERWFHSRHAVSYKLMPVFERGGFADTMEVAARWSDLVPCYDAIRRALAPTAVVMAHISHVYPEGGCIYFSFAGRGARPVYDATWAAALDAALDSGATVTHHHGVGVLKARAASRELGPGVAVWRRVKAALDPANVMNPGRLYVDAPAVDPGPPPPPRPEDHLARSRADASIAERERIAEPASPFERLPGPSRWLRAPWQTPWIEVAGTLDGQRFLIGRGPRSAAGPDVRSAAVASDPAATATWATAPAGPRWMGTGRPPQPWGVALALLRADLRPAVLTVDEGALVVGFRGPAAEAFGALAAALVPGGLAPIPYAPRAIPIAAELAELDDPDVVAVTPQGAVRRAR